LSLFLLFDLLLLHTLGDAQACREGLAETVYARVIEAAEAVLPPLHHEKVIYYDSLAQTRVIAGDTAGVHEYTISPSLVHYSFDNITQRHTQVVWLMRLCARAHTTSSC
jgi:hypothetical protein